MDNTPGRAHGWARAFQAVAVSLWGLAASGFASAAEPTGPSVYLEGGNTFQQGDDTRMATIGLRLPVQRTFWDGRVTAALDLYLSDWKADAVSGTRSQFSQIGLVPMFRYRFDAGQSPWFVEGGVGVSYLSASYQTANKLFSTQWNFSDHLGVGRSFGADHRQELGLYVKHVSNAGLRSPNPGESFLLLRYAYAF